MSWGDVVTCGGTAVGGVTEGGTFSTEDAMRTGAGPTGLGDSMVAGSGVEGKTNASRCGRDGETMSDMGALTTAGDGAAGRNGRDTALSSFERASNDEAESGATVTDDVDSGDAGMGEANIGEADMGNREEEGTAESGVASAGDAVGSTDSNSSDGDAGSGGAASD